MGAERAIVSWDIPRENKADQGRVNRLVFGYASRKRLGGEVVEYAYPGFVDRPGAERLGQSVVLLTPEDAGALEFILQELKVSHLVRHVSIRIGGVGHVAAAAVERAAATAP
jgi:hypothetical protein